MRPLSRYALLVLALVALLPRSAGTAPRITAFEPETVRLNSTVTVRGEDLGATGQARTLVLAGRLVRDGEARDVRVSLPGSAVGGREVRARLPRSLVEGDGSWLPGGRFEGTVAVAGASFPVALSVFPPDLLTVLVGWFGFADEVVTTPPLWAQLGALLVASLFLLLAVLTQSSQAAPGDFFAVFPHNTLVLMFGSVFAWALLALGLWLWAVLFPSPEAVIRKRLTEVARSAYIDEKHNSKFTLLLKNFHKGMVKS